MARALQIANTFIHLRFATVEAARLWAQKLASHHLANATAHGIERLAITRVAEHRII